MVVINNQMVALPPHNSKMPELTSLPSKTRKLTLKQKRFVDYYLETGNATEAARRAGYKQTSLSAIGTIAWENMQNPAIQNAISQALINYEITPEYIKMRLKYLAESGYVHNQLRALEDLAKLIQAKGFESPVSSHGTTINGDITISFGQPNNALPKPITDADYTIINDSQHT